MAGTLQDAILFTRQGQKLEARAILESLLRANPKDVSAWFWYAETLDSLEKRVQVLELCLKANPGNPQAEKALAALRARLQPPTPAFGSDEPASFNWDEPAPVAPVSDEPPMVWDDEPEEASASAGIDWDAIERQQAPQPAQPQHVFASEAVVPAAPIARPSFPFYEVWMTALTNQDMRAYYALLEDKDAGQGRAYEWMAYVGLVTGLLYGLAFSSTMGDALAELGTIDFLAGMDSILVMVILAGILAIFTCISSVLGLFISGVFQHFIALLFGGSGTFSRTVYALGAYLAPMTLLSTVVAIIPIVSCLSPLLGIYSLVLNVRALAAAHNMVLARALMVVLLPSLVIFAIMCLLLFLLWPTVTEIINAYPLY